jgi:hypothetical protein
MLEIVESGATPMPIELLPRTYPYGLADGGEVVSGAAVGDAFTPIRDEERYQWSAE